MTSFSINDSRIDTLLKAAQVLGKHELKSEITSFKQYGKDFTQLDINSELVNKIQSVLTKPYQIWTDYDITLLRLMYINLYY